MKIRMCWLVLAGGLLIACASVSEGSQLPELEPKAQIAEPPGEDAPEEESPSDEITLVSSEERLPEAEEHIIPDEYFVPPIETPAIAQVEEEEFEEIEEIEEIAAIEEDFQMPEIASPPPAVQAAGSLGQRDNWYIQLGAYSNIFNAENEMNRIGASYPVIIQNAGTDTKPLFRVLLGPVNQGEGAALLQRFRSIGYKDAFMRH